MEPAEITNVGATSEPVPAQRRWPGFQPGVSPNPTGSRVPKRFIALAAEFGGAEAIDAATRDELVFIAKLRTKAERAKDASAAAQMANVTRRMLREIRDRLKRPPAPPSSNSLRNSVLLNQLRQQGPKEGDQ
jgi:hypothetical protein